MMVVMIVAPKAMQGWIEHAESTAFLFHPEVRQAVCIKVSTNQQLFPWA